MNVLVTGADGLLGGNLTRELLGRGASVRVLVHPTSTSKSLEDLPVQSVRGDVTNPGDVASACRGMDFVYHCAAITDVRADPDLTWSVNLQGTENIIEACLGEGVQRLLFVGSASSFQFGSIEEPGDETGGYPADYQGIDYMDSKLEAMGLVQRAVAEQGLDAVILAPTFMLGPNDTRPSSGEIIVRYLASGTRLVPPGGRNFVHVCDVAKAAVAAMSRGEKGRVYLLAGENLSYKDFFAMVSAAVGIPAPAATVPHFAMRGAGVLGSTYEKVSGQRAPINDMLARAACLDVFYSPARAIRELDMPQTPIAEAIADSIRSLRALGHLPRATRDSRSAGGDLIGKTALISGGSRGLGYAIAEALAERGANLVITARGQERLERSREKLSKSGASVVAVTGDVGNWDDAQHMVDAAIANFGGLDILVNNAGVSMRGEFEHLSPEVCAKIVNTNLMGSINLSRAAVDAIVESKGSIVFISSIAGLFGLPGASVYCASKGAMRGLSESLRLELSTKGVHVGVVNLGFTEHDPDKRILAADGSQELPKRPAHHTQREAARQIIAMIDRRKREVTLTAIGKLGKLAYRLSPHVVERTIQGAQSHRWRVFRQFS